MSDHAPDLARAEAWCRSEIYGTAGNHVLKTLAAEYCRRAEEIIGLRGVLDMEEAAHSRTSAECARWEAEVGRLRSIEAAAIEVAGHGGVWWRFVGWARGTRRDMPAIGAAIDALSSALREAKP